MASNLVSISRSPFPRINTSSGPKYLWRFPRSSYVPTRLVTLSLDLWSNANSSSFYRRSTFLEHTSPTNIDCRNLFSDVLHRPFFCAHMPLKPYAIDIPTRNQIPRLSNLSTAEFTTGWTNQPFILTTPVREWPLYKNWSTETLLGKYGDIKFRAEAVEWPLRTYVEYMNDNQDESPLYLFDQGFVEKMDIKVGRSEGGQYWIPDCFGEDLFAVLGAQRPDDRWLIVGPERSGSTFHKDPNATRLVEILFLPYLIPYIADFQCSAWNAVVRGSKYWIMFPTTRRSPPPPGVFVSEDQSEVTSPLSIAEWLIGFHSEARKTEGCLEGICDEGEVLHVPSGWWHLVVNLSPSIAITQNFVPKAHLANALAFLKDKPDQVSGFKSDVHSPYQLFVQKMQEWHPDLLNETSQELDNTKENRKRKWDEVIKFDEGSAGGGFSFGFSAEDKEGIP